MEDQNEWAKLIQTLSDVKTEEYKKSFVRQLIEKTVTGKYQWDDPDKYKYYLYVINEFSVWISLYGTPPFIMEIRNQSLWSCASEPEQKLALSEEDRVALFQAIDLQMVNREAKRWKALTPKEGNRLPSLQETGVQSKLLNWLLSFVKKLFQLPT